MKRRADQRKHHRSNTPHERIALACQGGGSLGAYHVGAYEAMAEDGYLPDIVSGISIGAFTAAIIAGNDPDVRLQKLNEFWDYISWPEFEYLSNCLKHFPDISTQLRKSHNTISSVQGFVFGQPHFFVPRIPPPQLALSGTTEATSCYDTDPLRDTLLKFVDFDRINENKTRLILGATKVKDGTLVFFDSASAKITPEHVMASGSMPPGFPGVRIDGDLYWDGGCVSNAPLDGILEAEPKKSTLAFVVDLFNPKGKEPKNMDDVAIRQKEILFASRTSSHIRRIIKNHNLSHSLSAILNGLSKSAESKSLIKELRLLAKSHDIDYVADLDIVHIVYDAPPYEVPTMDCEFSKTSIEDRSEHGYADMKETLIECPWLAAKAAHVGSRVYKCVGGQCHEVDV
ncbi:MAG: patatin-like phospholipase family protein [Candidatus Magnetominusculus sp. LBB02]|nr:patatin-like phospholipase family protein [Candidatus Magnetominusculus sp. LBB02]